jgi:exonuclease SbcC
MNPLFLEFQAFGSYPGKVAIDFAPLASRGVFLVTGDTGTGKTTILDAMCFALYGEMPGKSAKEIRSHHAAETVRPYVKFTFKADGVVYVAERSLEYVVPRVRGAGTAKASFSFCRIESGVTHSLATKKEEMLGVVSAIVGLTAEHFQRVVLLPQGDVTRFLHADSTQREETLQKLFGGEIFKQTVDDLGRRRQQLEQQLKADDDRAADDLRTARATLVALLGSIGAEVTADPESSDAQAVLDLLADYEPGVEALERRVAELDDEFAAQNRKLGGLKEVLKQFDTAVDLRRQLAEVEPRLLEAEGEAEVAERSRKARAPHERFANLDRKVQEAETARSRRDESVSRVIGALRPFEVVLDESSATTLSSGIYEFEVRLAGQRLFLDELGKAEQEKSDADGTLQALISEREGHLATVETAKARLDTLSAQRAELEPSLQDTGVLEAERSELRRKLGLKSAAVEAMASLRRATDDRRRLTDSHSARLRQFRDTEAPRLAEQLALGSPCPVCGSTEHPAPAVATDTVPVKWDDVQAAAEELRTATSVHEDCSRAVTELRAKLGDDADVSMPDLEQRLLESEQRLAQAQATREQFDGIVREVTSTHQDLVALEATVAEQRNRVDDAQSAVGAADERLALARESASGIDPEVLGLASDAVESIREPVAALDQLFVAVVAADAARAEAELDAKRELEASGFADRHEVERSLIDLERESSVLEQVDGLRNQQSSLKSQIDGLSSQGLPVDRPDVDAQEAVVKSAQDDLQSARQAHADAAGHLRAARSSAEAARDRGASSAADRRRLEVLTRAHTVCSKGGVLNMPLQRWVLSRQLDLVTSAANVHLQRLSRGRYSLRRAEEVKDARRAHGLGLEVTDAETGLSRATTSMSGGEQFQAALALALGLADVVSRGGEGSGRRFEALFIDEGFGSLDQNALQQAIATLHELHSSGRMVGVITHVDAMKQELHPGIVVTRLGAGKGSTLTVNP